MFTRNKKDIVSIRASSCEMPGPPPLPRKLALPRKKVRVVSARQKVKAQTARRVIEGVQAATTEFMSASASDAQPHEVEKPNDHKTTNTKSSPQSQTQLSAS